MLMDPEPSAARQTFLKETERIVIRVGSPFAEEFEKEFREEVGKKVAGGLDAFESRIASMIVFVDGDGRKRKLL